MTFEDYFPDKWRDGWYENEYRLSPVEIQQHIFFNNASLEFSDPLQGEQASSFKPLINVSENEYEMRVVAQLEGVEKKDIEVILTSEGLLICWEKKEINNNGKKKYCYDCTYRSFERYIPFYTYISGEDIRVTFEDSLLTIVLPKAEEISFRIKKIPIQSADGRKSLKIEGSDPLQTSRPDLSRIFLNKKHIIQ